MWIISYLRQLDTLFGTLVTTRSWGTGQRHSADTEGRTRQEARGPHPSRTAHRDQAA